MSRKNNDSSILNVVHKTAKGLRDAGVMNEMTMREFDAMCLPPVKQYTSADIKKIRTRQHVSQPVFAAFLNVSKSTVAQWEQGDKKPRGASLKLLELVERKGLGELA
ncbi:MAG TPA: DNA-binding transcriptional regulator [Gammaproteobacteria bacterium]|nr:DNA-binding transcriptional regulator [Gammaproteobacteria bacterium]